MAKLLGILNITPDSFSDGGMYIEPQQALEQAQKLFDDGANYIDVGAQSTKPGAEIIGWEKEWKRLEPILEVLIKKYPEKISLDTFQPEIAQKFIDLGGTILNDVTGFQNPKMIEVAKKFFSTSYEFPADSHFIIVNHFPGESLAEVHEQEICSINQVREDLLLLKVQLIREGIPGRNIVLDPGIGFGKTMDLNHELVGFAEEVSDERVLIGHSRKRFLGEYRFDPQVNLEVGKQAIASGAEFLRVHELEGYKANGSKLPTSNPQHQVAIFGGLGSQTDHAVGEFKNLKNLQKRYYSSMEEVCLAVEKGDVEYGVLPIYNTVGGDVTESLKALEELNVKEVSRQVISITFHLAAKEKITLKQVKKVLSHWQSLAQSKAWLRENIAHVKKEEVMSSSEAARMVKSDPSKFVACICHHQTVLDEGLVFLANHIEESGNQTTFVCITRRNL